MYSITLFPLVQLPGFVNVTSTDVCVEDLHEEEPQDMTIDISIQSLLKIYDDVHVSNVYYWTKLYI